MRKQTNNCCSSVSLLEVEVLEVDGVQFCSPTTGVSEVAVVAIVVLVTLVAIFIAVVGIGVVDRDEPPEKISITRRFIKVPISNYKRSFFAYTICTRKLPERFAQSILPTIILQDICVIFLTVN